MASKQFKSTPLSLPLLVEEFKFEDGKRLLDCHAKVLYILRIARFQETDAQAKIQLRERDGVHNFHGCHDITFLFKVTQPYLLENFPCLLTLWIMLSWF